MDLYPHSLAILDSDAASIIKCSIVSNENSLCWERYLYRMVKPPEFSVLRLRPIINQDGLQMSGLNLKALIDPNILNALNHFVVEDYSAKGLELDSVLLESLVTRHPLLDDVVIIRNFGPRLIEPRPECTVFVDESCGIAVLRGSHVYANGIIGAPPTLRAGVEVCVFAVLDHVKKGLKALETYTGPRVFVGVGESLVDRATLFFHDSPPVSGPGVRMTRPLFVAPSLNELEARLERRALALHLPSLLVAHNLDLDAGVLAACLEPRPAAGLPSGCESSCFRVLDMCAAPGGKCFHIADRLSACFAAAALSMRHVHVVALDHSKAKINQMRATCTQLNLEHIVSCEAFDSSSSELIRSERSAIDAAHAEELAPCGCRLRPPFSEASFARVLLDAPCSALGQRPRFTVRDSAARVRSHSRVQRALLVNAVRVLARGGTLVYSTCTLLREENEELVAWLLARFPGALRLEHQAVRVGRPGEPKVKVKVKADAAQEQLEAGAGNGDEHPQQEEASLDASLCSRLQKFDFSADPQLPHTPDADTIGFFIAKLYKL